MKKIQKIRDIFWPLIDKGGKETYHNFSPNQIKLKDSNMNIALDLLLKNAEEEKERLKSVESKSTTFIWILSLSITILFSFSKFIFQPALTNVYSYIYNFILFFIILAILLYSFRSVFFAVQTLKRETYFQLGYKDLINNNDKDYIKNIMAKAINNLNRNSKTINKKVDFLTLSQMYFLRAIFSILTLGLLIIINQLLIYF